MCRCRCSTRTRCWSDGRFHWPAVARWCYDGSSRHSNFFPTAADTARLMRTTWENRSRMCSPPRSCPTMRTIRSGRCTATRVPPATWSGSPAGSAPSSSTGSARPRAGWRADAPPGSLGLLPDGTEIIDVETGRPCPPGVTGELVNIGGRGRFEGYYNDPEADAQRMAGGIYHSGDLAYRDEDGYAYFAGRLGDWMRVDGENLGAAPIERVLLRHPDVVEAAVYGIPAPDVGDQVMAALLLTEGATFDVAAFRAFLAAQPDLGPKQWPSYLRISASLPRTETFKVIKRQLAAQGTDCDDPVWEIPRGR